jgi:hypothetical protein
MRLTAALFFGSLLILACGNPRGDSGFSEGTTASEKLAEARAVAAAYLPDAVLCEALGLDCGPTFGDGLCPDWTYTFYSATAASVVRVHLGFDGLMTLLGEPERLLPDQSPPAWDGGFDLDSDFAAKSASMAGAGAVLAEGIPVSERLRLYAQVFPDGVKPLWELTYTVRDAEGFKSQTVTVDAVTGRMLETGEPGNPAGELL